MSRPRFRKEADAPDDVVGVTVDLGSGSSERRIRCPRCQWQPGRADRWQCVCSHLWHTFETRGRCPACMSQWHDTQCLRCTEWSRHRDWYTDRSRRG